MLDINKPDYENDKIKIWLYPGPHCVIQEKKSDSFIQVSDQDSAEALIDSLKLFLDAINN